MNQETVSQKVTKVLRAKQELADALLNAKNQQLEVQLPVLCGLSTAEMQHYERSLGVKFMW